MSTESESTADQAGKTAGDSMIAVSIQGSTPEQVRAVAQRLFADNFPRLSQSAQETVTSRASDLAEAFIEKAIDRGVSLSAAADPDVQYLLLASQRDYARSGNDSLKKLLVDLLVERSSAHEDLEKIVLGEAIETARKLTSKQISALTICWLLRSTTPTSVQTFDDFIDYAQVNYQPFCSNLPVNNSEYAHIQYTGSTIPGMGNSLGYLLSNQVPGLFQRGFPVNAIPEPLWQEPVRQELFSVNLYDSTLWQVDAPDEPKAREKLAKVGLSNLEQQYVGLLNSYRHSDEEVEKRLIDSGAFWADLIHVWQSTNLSSLTASSVGTAIAHSNWVAVTGGLSPLSTWITENKH